MSVTPSQLTTLLTGYFSIREPVLVTGAPGIGKSDIIAQAATANGMGLLISHPVTADPTDAKGLPWPVQGSDHATFLPFGDLYQAINATSPMVWFLDDLGQASPAVQAAFMQLLLARRVNGHALPECVTFAAATNRRIDRAGVSGILEPVKSRFASIVELETNIDEWSQWAIANGIPYTLLAFLRYRPELLCKFEATADLTNSPVPRTWKHLADVESLGLSLELESEAMSGAVGNGAAIEYIAFRQMARSLQNLDAILLDPSKAAIPSKPDQLYATVVGLASRANETNFARIVTYAQRMYSEADKGEYAALLIRDSQRRESKVAYTDAYVRMQCSPLGQLLTGKA
jgi:hypothetical protein